MAEGSEHPNIRAGLETQEPHKNLWNKATSTGFELRISGNFFAFFPANLFSFLSGSGIL